MDRRGIKDSAHTVSVAVVMETFDNVDCEDDVSMDDNSVLLVWVVIVVLDWIELFKNEHTLGGCVGERLRECEGEEIWVWSECEGEVTIE